MTTKHPERRPVDQVEGAVRVDDLANTKLRIYPASERALRGLIAVLARTAERRCAEKSNHKKAA